MIIYKDKITGDELFSDIYKMVLIDDLVWEVYGKLTTETMDTQNINIGANASAEGGDDEGGVDSNSVSGVDIVLANRLFETSFDPKSYRVHIKEYMKSIKEKLTEDDPDRIPAFTAGAQKFVGALLKDKARFVEFQFFLGESMNPDGHVAFMEWRDEVPVMMFFKDGLIAEKV